MSQHMKPFACGRCAYCENGDPQNCLKPLGGCRCAECVPPVQTWQQRAEKAEREVLSLKADVDEQRGMSEHHHSMACDYAEERNEERERAEKAEALVREMDLAVRVALAFTRPCVEGAMHLLDVERVETAADLTNYLRVVLAKVGK